MPKRRQGARILGPYSNRGGWIVFEVAATGDRTSLYFEKEADALEYRAEFEAELQRNDTTTESAIKEYLIALKEAGNRETSVASTEAALKSFFPTSLSLHLLTPRRIAQLYEDLRTRPSKRTGKPLAADTHRNRLSEVKTFLAWCVERGYLTRNPAERVKGKGKRRPRGKSLGKSGEELRIKEARKFYTVAVRLANAGDQGATVALVAMLLGMRASEIVSRRVRDLDEDAEPGDLLWIPDSKTAAGKRTLEVPEVLRPLLVAQTEGKGPDRHLFETRQPKRRSRSGRPPKPPKPHWRDWVKRQVRRVCSVAGVPGVTAHAMRGLLATLAVERGMAGHLVAATLGHEDERTTFRAYAAVGAAEKGARNRGLKLIRGGG